MTADADAVASIMVGGGRSAASGDGGAVDVAVDALASVAGRSGRPAVGAGVTRVFTTVLTAMWEGGWQPAEVVRAVRRARSARHADLVGVAIAACPLALAGAPGPWVAQLEEIDATSRWWGEGDDWLEPWAERAKLHWLLAVQVAVEALGVLLPLPKLEQLLPPPSAWSKKAWVAPTPGGADDAMLAKVRALLAKAESTSFEAEADALTAKAQELMSRHSIDDLLAGDAAPHGARPSVRRVPVDDPYSDAKSSLLLAVASANSVRCVWHPDLALMTVVGFPADLDSVETLFTSLLVQATRSMVTTGATAEHKGRSTTRSYRHSFLLSFAVRIGERLASAAAGTLQAAEAELAVSLLPVLVRREAEIDDVVGEMFPKLVRRRAVSASNVEGWDAGRSAADRAHLDTARAPLDRTAEG